MVLAVVGTQLAPDVLQEVFDILYLVNGLLTLLRAKSLLSPNAIADGLQRFQIEVALSVDIAWKIRIFLLHLSILLTSLRLH
jgi:hypothetical protein